MSMNNTLRWFEKIGDQAGMQMGSANMLPNNSLTRVLVLSLLFLFSAPFQAASQEIPKIDELRSRLAGMLSGYWTIDDFRVVSSVAQGDPITPKALIRFEADVSTTEDLFTSMGEEAGPFLIVVKTQEKGITRTLYGTMQLSYAAGMWSGDPVLENPVSGLGKPGDLFARPILTAGSEAQDELLATLRSRSIADFNTKLEASLRSLQRSHEEEIAKIESDHKVSVERLSSKLESQRFQLAKRKAEEIEALKSEYQATKQRLQSEMAALLAANEAELTELQATHQKALDTAKSEFEARLADLKAGYTSLINNAQQRLDDEATKFQRLLDQEKSELTKQHNQELENLKVRHAENVAKIKTEQAEAVVSLETGLTEKLARTKKDINLSDQVIEQQNQLIAKLQATGDNENYIHELMQQKKDRRLTFMRSFSSGLRGAIACKDRSDSSYGTAVKFIPKEIVSSDISGDFIFNGSNSRQYKVPSVLSFNSETFKYPLKFTLVVDNNSWERYYPDTLNLLLSDNGKFVGTVKSCTLTMSG